VYSAFIRSVCIPHHFLRLFLKFIICPNGQDQ
jgi:hypothetical protein